MLFLKQNRLLFLCFKSHRFRTANIDISFTNSMHRCYSYYLYQLAACHICNSCFTCLEFADRFFIIAVLKRWLLELRETEAIFAFMIFCGFIFIFDLANGCVEQPRKPRMAIWICVKKLRPDISDRFRVRTCRQNSRQLY